MADLAELQREVQEVEARLVAQVGRLAPAPAPAPVAVPEKKGAPAGAIAMLVVFFGLLGLLLFRLPREARP